MARDGASSGQCSVVLGVPALGLGGQALNPNSGTWSWQVA